jgi:hypothetical protein
MCAAGGGAGGRDRAEAIEPAVALTQVSKPAISMVPSP